MLPIAKHVFIFNPEDNSGEQLTLTTHIYGTTLETYCSHILELNSYGNRAIFNLTTELTPAKLRKLADELEKIELNSQGV